MDDYALKDALIADFAKIQASFHTEKDQHLIFSFAGQQFFLSNEEVLAYGRCRDTLDSVVFTPDYCTLYNAEYREQALRLLESSHQPHNTYRLAHRPLRFAPLISSPLAVTLASVSELFLYKLIFDPQMSSIVLPSLIRHGSPYRSLLHYARRLLFTLRVAGLTATSPDQALRQSHDIVTACLFSATYNRLGAFWLADHLPYGLASPTPPRKRQAPRSQNDALDLPVHAYNETLVRFYELAVSSTTPEFQFLSFYHVLEFFFVVVSDEQLYDRLRTLLRDPAFHAKPSQLDALILAVQDHNRITDETEMLKLVLQKYIHEEELIAFIQDYEEDIGEPFYTKQRTRWGVTTQVKLQPGHTCGNVATVIKTVRNAIVHSSDHHERTQRHVPFSAQARDLAKEVPLARFLAERIIIASAP